MATRRPIGLWQVLRDGGDGQDRNDARELGEALLKWAGGWL